MSGQRQVNTTKRPRRTVAIEGEKRRREAEVREREQDARFYLDMGTAYHEGRSTDTHTVSGIVRRDH